MSKAALRWIELALLSALILIYGWATYQRNLVWKDDTTLWADVVKKSSDKARPYIWLGLDYQKRELTDEAIFLYEKALSLNPQYADAADAHNNLGLCYVDKGMMDEAIKQFELAIQISPYYLPSHTNLGFIYVQLEKYSQALEEFNAILKIDPHNEMAYSMSVFCQESLRNEPKNTQTQPSATVK